jgi:hypothetical protein
MRDLARWIVTRESFDLKIYAVVTLFNASHKPIFWQIGQDTSDRARVDAMLLGTLWQCHGIYELTYQ